MKIWFSSDTHFDHQNILRSCDRPFSNAKEMNDAIIARHNERVSSGDRVYHLGDFCMSRDPKRWAQHLWRLNGQIYLIRGNHDNEKTIRNLIQIPGIEKKLVWVKDYYKLTVQDKTLPGKKCFVVLSHYAMRTWEKSHWGAFQLYGHCLDLKTEILTKEGWKFRKDLSANDLIASVSQKTEQVEYVNPTSIVDVPNYAGKIYRINSKNVDARVTSKHCCILVKPSDGIWHKKYAENLLEKTNLAIPTSANGINKSSLKVSNNLLRLLVWIGTDGSLENTSLIRFHLKKERKIKRLTDLLKTLKISYSFNRSKTGTVKINFSKPVALASFRLKPIDPILKEMSFEQAGLFFQEYQHTDGTRPAEGHKSFQLSTSKKEEADLIQQIAVTNGFRCNQITRRRSNPKHGKQYVLSCNYRKFWQTTKSHKNVTEEISVNEHFWCVRVPNQIIIVRRNGKCHITGNSHGNLAEDPKAKQMDVGVDTNDFYPYSYEEVRDYLLKK